MNTRSDNHCGGVGEVRARKEPGGFWVPNELIDLHLADLGPEGLAVYCLLARCVTPKRYPSVNDLSALLCRGERYYPARRVARILLLLHERGILNDFDLRAVGEAADRPSNLRCDDERAFAGDNGDNDDNDNDDAGAFEPGDTASSAVAVFR